MRVCMVAPVVRMSSMRRKGGGEMSVAGVEVAGVVARGPTL